MQESNQPTLDTSSEAVPDEAVIQVETKPQKTKTNRMKLTLLLLGVLIIILAGAFVYRIVTDSKSRSKDQSASQNTQSNTVANQETNTSAVDKELERFTNPTTGEVWLEQVKKVANQGFLNTDAEDLAEYYEVGSRDGGTIYLVIDNSGMGGVSYLYEKTKDNKISFVAKPDTNAVYSEEILSYEKKALKTGVFYDEITHYDSLSFPTKGVEVGKGQTLYKKALNIGYLNIENNYKDQEKTLKQLGKSNIVRSDFAYADTGLTNITYYWDTPAHTRLALTYQPLSDGAADISWSKGYTSASGALNPIAKGCSISGVSVTRTDTLKDSDFVSAGKTRTGETAYQLVDNNYKLLTKAYDEYKEFYSYDASHAILSKEDFVKSHGLVFIKDSNGEWLVYVNSDLAPQGGCAKPVVYLYPKEVTNVTVRVGADVKVYEPLYNKQTGWSVTAYPGGSLTVNNQQYNSLFWEGPGYGAYPYLEGRGIVVKTSDALLTIKKQLHDQGFNNTEVNDFLAYWSDKMPKKPYTRITWLTTEEMNTLAPLYLSPKADTVIRTFLDYEGLDEYKQLTPQQFSPPARKGFTVVEWGGLSPYKLY